MAESNDTAPVVRIFDCVDLQTRIRVGTQNVDFATRQRMDVDELTVEQVIDRHYIRFIMLAASQPTRYLFSQKLTRFRFSHSADHFSSPSLSTSETLEFTRPRISPILWPVVRSVALSLALHSPRQKHEGASS